MTSPAGQGESCDSGEQQSRTAPIYCSTCGRLADGTIRRGLDAFCSPEHAEEFAREVAAARAPSATPALRVRGAAMPEGGRSR